LVLLLLILRFAIKKKDKDSRHLFDYGFIWNDYNDGIANKDFMDFETFSDDNDWYTHCIDRNYGPNRNIVALAPSGNSIITSVKQTIDQDLVQYNLTTQLFSSREDIMKVIEASSYEKDGNTGICFGAVLETSDSTTNEYQLNMIFDDITFEASDDSNMPNQEFDAVDKYQREPYFDAWKQYRDGGYTYLQNIFANHILKDRTSASSYISMIYLPVKSSDYKKDDFIYAATEMWEFFMLFLFLPPLYRLVYNSVNEKETKIREAMKIMGLTDTPYWLSWFTYFLIINTILASVMTLLLIPVFEYSSKLIIFMQAIWTNNVWICFIYWSFFFIRKDSSSCSKYALLLDLIWRDCCSKEKCT